jgi:multidrug resistance efflux pump
MRLKLDWEASILKIEQSAHERSLASLTAQVKREEYYAAEDAIDRRRIDSPIDGVVTDVYVHEGEWVKPGDTVLRIISLKRLRVKGFLKRADHDPNDIDGKTVTVKAKLTGGREETFTGKITNVAQEILDGESFAVWAEVDNRKPEGGKYYMLQPGMTVDLEIEK